jgi:AraC-like DNA-binding protein
MAKKASAIPSTGLDTDLVRPHERFALWRDALASTHEATLPANANPARFKAFARGWNLGEMMVIETRANGQILARSSSAIRADQVDHYVIRVQRDGRWNGEAGERAVQTRPGGVMVLDMAQPTIAHGVGIDNINVFIPRDVLDRILPPFDVHGLAVHGSVAALLRSHLEMLVQTLPHIPQQAAPEIARATCSLVAACLAPSPESGERAKAPIALGRLTEIRRHIDRNLLSPNLTPDSICRALGLSRSTAYAVCESHGGIAAFIQQRRLDRIHTILSDPREHRPISEIAYQYGFASRAHFSRAFRAAFGYTASEVRGEPGSRPSRREADQASTGYRAWVRQLSR